jgi:hypothetical protein
MSTTDQPPPIAKITTTLSIGGQDFDPDQLTQITGHSPSNIWRAKIQGVKDNPAFNQIEWSYSQARKPHWSIDDAISEILDVFKERRESILAFARQHECSLHISIQLHGDSTVIVYRIERETVELLAAFRCSMSFVIDFDFIDQNSRLH